MHTTDVIYPGTERCRQGGKFGVAGVKLLMHIVSLGVPGERSRSVDLMRKENSNTNWYRQDCRCEDG